ncbi:PorP/SprF family type IX secretion system membrane protein [Spongiimicrobium salis]|uniref:PorP/SprF family type IX secretion system membrane protein n=1 Tax=Spongiimicrobium salis TaxID=1667022 RepID=UPI00374DB46C
MTKSVHFFLIVLIWGIGKLFCQQSPTFTEYNYNPFIINAAYAGVLDNPEATLSNIGFGAQGFDGAPRSFALTFNTVLQNESVGLGAGVIRDEIGVTTATQLFAAYSYKIFLNDNTHPYWKVYDRSFISFGLNAGALLYNQNLLQLGIEGDPNFSENINSTLPALGAGVLFGHANFFAGIASPNFLGDTFANQDNLRLSRPIYAYTGYHFILNRFNPDYVFKPSLLLKYESGAAIQIDTNISLSIKKSFEVGVGFRTSQTLSALVGFYALKNFRFLYSYNQGNSDSPLGTTHGIILSYRGGEGYH